MGQITAWKVDETGEIFEDKKKYSARLGQLTRERNAKEKRDAIIAQRQAVFAEMRATVRNSDQLVQFIKDHWTTFAANGCARVGWWKDEIRTRTEFHNLTMFTVNAFKWDGRSWYWQIAWDTDKKNDSTYEYGPSIFEGTGINISGGGTAGTHYGQFHLPSEDWPALAESWEAARFAIEIGVSSKQVDEIATNYFDTTESVREFYKKYPPEKIEAAKTWKIISNSKMSLRNIIDKEMICE